MTPTEVLKMLKSKIDAAGLNKCNYAIETSDIEAINEALVIADVSESHLAKCDVCGCHPSVIIRTEFGTFCQAHARYVR
jgi:hypothetical protein